MKLFRVVIATESMQTVVEGQVQTVPVIQHVVFVVAPDRRSVPKVMREDSVLGKERGIVPRIAEELDVAKTWWPVKVGPNTDEPTIFVVVPGLDQSAAQIELLATYAKHEAIAEMLSNGWYEISPRPIDTTKPGVW